MQAGRSSAIGFSHKKTEAAAMRWQRQMRVLWRRPSVQFEAKELSQPIWRPKKEIFARSFVFRQHA
ncbi:MAG: hypothetical protein DMF03_00350 [Verrucomicrobia bacterium]|nr:MAG: hypothetical protein DMF03_00350 [Verrucomicrobiota bacterium]